MANEGEEITKNGILNGQLRKQLSVLALHASSRGETKIYLQVQVETRIPLFEFFRQLGDQVILMGIAWKMFQEGQEREQIASDNVPRWHGLLDVRSFSHGE
jgi:hypothetical protein